MTNATLTRDEADRIAAEYRAACRAKFGDAWQQPSDATVLRWAMDEVTEYADAVAKFIATGERDEAAMFKEVSDVIYLLMQIESDDLRREAATVIRIPSRYAPFTNPTALEVYRAVHRDNLRRIETATIGPDGKIEKAKDYDKSALMREIEGIVK